MPIGQVTNMNIIPDTCPILSWIILPEDTQLFPFPRNNFLNKGKQIIGINIGLITQHSRLMRSTRIKIPQRNNPPLWISLRQWPHKHFNSCFWLPIRTRRWFYVSLDTIVFVTVNSGGRRKDKVWTCWKFLHHFEEIDGTKDIVLIVLNGLKERLTDCF